MPFYTICATNRLRAIRPCAVYFGASSREVQQRFDANRRIGAFAFLAQDARVSVRRSSRREVEAYQVWIGQQGAVPMADSDPGRGARIARLESAFFERLWREGARG